MLGSQPGKRSLAHVVRSSSAACQQSNASSFAALWSQPTGGEGLQGTYGSLTAASLARIAIRLLQLGMTLEDGLFDVGFGLGG